MTPQYMAGYSVGKRDAANGIRRTPSAYRGPDFSIGYADGQLDAKASK